MQKMTQGDNGLELGRNLTFGLLDQLGRAIITGEYKNSSFPTEAELAIQFGVSRSVTREAVKMLGAKGLLSARPRQGTVVRPPEEWNLFDVDVLRWTLSRKFSVSLLREFSELRVAIEPEAAALAALRRDEQDITSIFNALDRMRRAEQGLEDVLESDIEFHLAILAASKNPFYLQMNAVVSTALQTSIRLTNKIQGRTADVEEHALVGECIRMGDSDGARSAMARLIRNVITVIDKYDMPQGSSREASGRPA